MTRWIFIVGFVAACAGRHPPAGLSPAGPFDVVLIPGCPSQEDGTLSGCQWQRVLWGVQLWEDGVTKAFITSGGAVHGKYIEAEAMKAGLVSMGVPEGRVYTETQAMHSDQNASYAMAMADTLGMETIGVASHGGHAKGIRSMIRGWGHQAVLPLKMPTDEIGRGMHGAHPDVRSEPVPDDEWLPLREREKLLAQRMGKARRPNSVIAYTWLAISGTFGTARRPMPPVPEPSLCGQRHRIDTAPWPTDVCQPAGGSTP